MNLKTKKYMKNLHVFNAHNLLNGEMAREAAILVEQEFMSGNYERPEKSNESDNYTYKDDDGNWRMSGSNRIFNTYEELSIAFNLD